MPQNEKLVPQKTIIIKARITEEMNNKIKNLLEEKNISVSEMIRLLVDDYFRRKKNKEMKEDVEHFLNSKPKIYRMGNTNMRHMCDTKA